MIIILGGAGFCPSTVSIDIRLQMCHVFPATLPHLPGVSEGIRGHIMCIRPVGNGSRLSRLLLPAIRQWVRKGPFGIIYMPFYIHNMPLYILYIYIYMPLYIYIHIPYGSWIHVLYSYLQVPHKAAKCR